MSAVVVLLVALILYTLLQVRRGMFWMGFLFPSKLAVKRCTSLGRHSSLLFLLRTLL